MFFDCMRFMKHVPERFNYQNLVNIGPTMLLDHQLAYIVVFKKSHFIEMIWSWMQFFCRFVKLLSKRLLLYFIIINEQQIGLYEKFEFLVRKMFVKVKYSVQTFIVLYMSHWQTLPVLLRYLIHGAKPTKNLFNLNSLQQNQQHIIIYYNNIQ